MARPPLDPLTRGPQALDPLTRGPQALDPLTRGPQARPFLVAVLDGGALGREPGELGRALFEAGVDWIQLRDRTLEAASLLALARALVGARDAATGRVRDTDAGRALRVIVNKRCDVALAAEADGVHLGLDAIDGAQARALFRAAGADGAAGRRRTWIGASLHSVAELEQTLAAGEPPDYVHLAPIWSPRSKPAERPELGPRALAQAARIAGPAGVHVIAQGGLDVERAARAVEAGAAGIAVTGLLTQAPDPAATARALRARLDQAASEAPPSSPRDGPGRR